MYLTFDQVVLVQDKRKVRPDDPLVYVRQHPNMGRVFTTGNTEIRRELGWGDPFEYGYLYFDAQETPCIVPHRWDEDDAMLAKSSRSLEE
jgi:hypothetical protein